MYKALISLTAILVLAAFAVAQAPPPDPGQGPGPMWQGQGRRMGPGFGPGQQGGPGQWGPQRRFMGQGMGQGMGPGMGRGMGPGMGPMQRRGMGPGPRVMEALNLTAEQRTQLRQQHFTHQVAAEKLHSDIRVKHLELQQLMSGDTMDRPKVDAKMKEISDLRLQAQKARLDQREAFLKILTPEQKEKLKTLRPGNGFAPGMRRNGPPPPQEEQ